MEPVFELPIELPPLDSRRRLRSLHGQLRAAILDGRLQAGLALPSSRALAAACGVSRNTAVAAYELLLSEGYVRVHPRGGTFVADGLSRSKRRVPEPEGGLDRHLNARWRDAPDLDRPLLASPPRLTSRLDFRLGLPDAAAFPSEVWRRLSAQALRALSKGPAEYAEPRGQPALREAIAAHVSFARAVACRAEDVIVTAGAQQAFDLLARVLVTPGQTVVALENPGYPPLRVAFAAAGAAIAPTAVDTEGLVVDRLPKNARVICVTPSHQFPLGIAMSAPRRMALLEFARRRNAVIVEDDYDGEFRFGGRPLDALQTLDRAESVLYVGTFSKSLFPSLRLGFVVAPAWARGALVAAKQCADWHCPVHAQDTLAAFIAQGHLARHVRKMRRLYDARRRTLLAGLQKDFARWLDVVPSSAGLHLAAFAKPSVDAEAVALRARERGIGVRALRDFYFHEPARSGLVFGYGATGEAIIAEGLSRLKRLWGD